MTQGVIAPTPADSKPRLCYRIAETAPPLLREIFEKQGWQPYVEGESEYWNLWWKGSRYRVSEYANCRPWQRMNHFPKTAVVTRKDMLFRTLKTMRGIHGKVYDYFPQTFSLPNDYVKFVRVYAEEEERGEKSIWICKPADLSRGRKIFVFRNLQDLTYDCNAILQRYIPNPLLISGYKFDLRCYVLVRSFNPLCIYLYDEGLARFATSLYDVTSLENRFSHLTNTSINKFSPTLNVTKEGVGSGCKWDFKRLRRYFEMAGMNFEKIWERMTGIMILTLLPLVGEVKMKNEGCFELYGFDLIIDEALRPWLLEVNLSPALSVDSQVDIDVKKPLLEDVLKLVDLSPSDAEAAKTHFEISSQPDLRSSRRRSTTASTPPVIEAVDYREEVGDFKKVYPFNDATRRMEFGKAGNVTIKSVIQEVKKKYMTGK